MSSMKYIVSSQLKPPTNTYTSKDQHEDSTATKRRKSSVSFKETFYSFPQLHIPLDGENNCVRTHKEKNHVTLQRNQNGGEKIMG